MARAKEREGEWQEVRRGNNSGKDYSIKGKATTFYFEDFQSQTNWTRQRGGELSNTSGLSIVDVIFFSFLASNSQMAKSLSFGDFRLSTGCSFSITSISTKHHFVISDCSFYNFSIKGVRFHIFYCRFSLQLQQLKWSFAYFQFLITGVRLIDSIFSISDYRCSNPYFRFLIAVSVFKLQLFDFR
ncbi:hypothetical protein L2E82_05127 [Cichorium intybus]|uniref:Uncharacterized protein n=1 Tax=Cichorium intybus TaxID=13427 RepID=A0ACB9H877_CICIN|nr:hypothetical protein L2E82_05127 [Cichorium intybus]